MENSVIITEYQFINSEINHKIYSPNRWYTTDELVILLKKICIENITSSFIKISW